MMISDPSALPFVRELAVIINVNTRRVTTLALLSTLRHASVPTLLIDCESTDGSLSFFQELMQEHDFYLLSAPLRPHGKTLGWLVRAIRAERILLIDSDIELLNGEMLGDMRSKLDQDIAMYGSGFLQEGAWLQSHYGTDLPLGGGIGYYKERPWIPFTLLRVSPVRTALEQGQTFMHELVLNEFVSLPALSRFLWRRFRFATFRRRSLPVLNAFRRSHRGLKPAYLFCDTGANLHEYLRARSLCFGSVPAGNVPWSLVHFQGITRGILQGESEDTYVLDEAEKTVRDRLREGYGMLM